MLDEFNRVNTKAQVIRSLDKADMACLLNDIKNNPDKYPQSQEEWLEWLNKSSGNNTSEI